MNATQIAPELPFLAKKDEFLKTVRENQVVILDGPTGSGKTTQGAKALFEAGYGELGTIGITEPRRIAATSVAPYVASLMNPEDTEKVRYKIRFSDSTDDRTAVKFMTDGILLEEFLYDLDLSKYSVIMVDEAHERSQNIDFLLGLLKRLLPHRPDFRVVVASATIDTGKFSEFFGGAPIVHVAGRMYPVEMRYSETPHFGESFNPHRSVLEAAETILEIHRHEGEGDILAFVPGKDDIADVIDRLAKSGETKLELLPAYGRMDIADQNAIFLDYPGKRKVIVATNVAETSITPVGVRFIVDTGLIKEMHFKPKTGLRRLKVFPHSKSGCDQRAGRAGRTQDGICYRLYTREEYDALPLYTQPEIQRTSLAGVILKMYFIGIHDVERFPFIDRPNHGLFAEAHETLRFYEALDKNNVLTKHGLEMAKLPLDPYISQMLLMAVKHGCVSEMTTIAAMLSSQNVMLRPPGEEKVADEAHEMFEAEEGDAFTSLNIWKEYQKHEGDMDWYQRFYLNEKSLIEVKNVREDLLALLKGFGIAETTTKDPNRIGKAVMLGLSQSLYRRSKRGNSYFPMNKKGGEEIFVHPGSSAYDTRPDFMVAGEVVETTKKYGRFCTAVKPEWLKGTRFEHALEEIRNEEREAKRDSKKEKTLPRKKNPKRKQPRQPKNFRRH